MLANPTYNPDTTSLIFADNRRDTSQLRSNQRIYFNMRTGVLPIHVSGEMVIGRFPGMKIGRDVADLSAFDAQSYGVSRKHIKVIKGSDDRIYIVDLWSSNGTYINEEKLDPYVMYPLDNGDVVRLGDFVIHMLFS